MLFTFLIILIVIAAVLLVFIVLAQNPKGGGLAQGFSGSNQFMGVQGTNKFLNQATWGLVGFIAVASIITAGIGFGGDDADQNGNTELQKEAKQEIQRQQQTTAPAAPAANPFQAPAAQ